MRETMKYKTIKDNYGKVGVVFPRQTVNAGDDETPYLPKTINDLIPKKVYEPQQDRRYDTPQRRVPDGSNEPYVAPTLSDIIKGGR